MDVGPSARRQGVLGLSGKASMYGDQAVGSSVGISVDSYLLTRNNQVNHATVASHVTAFNHVFDNSTVRKALSPWTASRRAALDQVIQTQASIISYIDDFKLMMILSLAAIPPSSCCCGARLRPAKATMRW